ncbi:DUF6573 family protein [Agromyces sp. S2-1-8]|uniref:DUF6573 family protein n=1 Tax=Agromyces sp. S2-1-8 TaxID=2897180 RepID=UPI001E42CDB8|nr:DUF6573 family protein [Agromyces sp. S2-1-8]MCD5348435.1 hypothetical protein [Agromyces sp. S2-1-8]
MTTTSADFWADARVIHAYTRAQALVDGVLVDATDTARQAGYTVPVALTRGAWAAAVEWSRDDGLQDEAGRLWDVLWMGLHAAKRSGRGQNRVEYTVHVVPNDDDGASGYSRASVVTLALHIGPGDNAEPVMTIMLPNED